MFPVMSSDLTYKTLAAVHLMPGQKDLVLGWNVTSGGTYYLSEAQAGIRVQHWRSLTAKQDIIATLKENDD